MSRNSTIFAIKVDVVSVVLRIGIKFFFAAFISSGYGSIFLVIMTAGGL